MGLTTTVEEGLTEAVTQSASYNATTGWMSLHSADPGSSGTNEVTTGTGTYARQPVTFSGSGGIDTNNADVVFTLAATQTAAWVGLWDAQTGGTFVGGFPMAGQQFTATALTGGSTVDCPGHPFSAGSAVKAFAIPGLTSSLPTGISPDTTYYVIASGLTADTFELSATMGGSAITFSTSGGFAVAVDNSQTAGGVDETLSFPATTGVIYSTVS
jgi:hypothetical protein